MTRIDFRHIENVVDQAEKSFARIRNDSRVAELLGIQWRLE